MTEDLTAAIEGLFAEVGEDFADAYITVGDDKCVAVAFVNGAYKVEGERFPPAPPAEEVVQRTLDAISAEWPNHANQRMHWRCRPGQDRISPTYLRLAVEPWPVKTDGATHVFAGAPDARQSTDVAMETSRFRPRYRALTEDEKALHDAIKAKAAELEGLFDQVCRSRQPAPYPGDSVLPPPSKLRYLAIATTDLESAVMYAVKALTL